MNVFLKAIKPEKAPKALGPYSPAVKLGDFVYLSGQIPLNPDTVRCSRPHWWNPSHPYRALPWLISLHWG